MKWLFVARPLIVVMLVTLAFTLSARFVYADSPPNLTSDIQWDEDSNTAGNQQTYSGVAAIEAAFNNARRQEEQQLGLTNGTLGNLTLPAQAQWDNYSNNQKGLFLTNAERVARNGIRTNVIGKPLSGIEDALRTIAQNYAQYLVDHNTSGHTANGSPTDRLNAVFGDPVANPGTACREFMARTENIASFWSFGGTSIPLAMERAVYDWIYADADSSWGHREASLLQDITLDNNPWGYHDNVGANGNEGYIGFGYVSNPNYDPFNFGGVTAAVVIVMNIIDPSTNNGCTYTVLPGAPVQINSSVMQTNVKAVYSATPQACAATGSNLPVSTVTPTLRNTSATVFTGLFFQVRTLEYVQAQGGQVPKLCNATTVVDHGGVGSALAISNSSLPGNDNAYNQNDDLTLAFVVGLPVRANYRIFVDLFYNGVTAAANGSAGALQLGSLVYEFDGNGQLIKVDYTIFLPQINVNRH